MSAQERLRRLEKLLLEQKEAGCLSVEALLDLLLCLYTECSNSPLKREKHITDFLNWGKNRDPNRTGDAARVPGWLGSYRTVLGSLGNRWVWSW